jgi:WD40 repeat protein
MENYFSIQSLPDKRITLKSYIADLPAVQCVKFDEEGVYLAAGCNGKIAMITSAKMHTINTEDSVTSLCWKPRISTAKTKNVVIVGESLGGISQWHCTSRKQVYNIQTPSEVFSIDYHRWFNLVVCGGRDGILRIYDDITQSLVTEFEQKHTNRIFCVKSHPEDENLLISGGWDSTIQVWDIRVPQSIRSILGPHICGESIDLKNSFLLAGSWRDKNSLQVFDFASGHPIRNLSQKTHSWIYSSKFSEDGESCVAVGSNENQLLLFDNFEQTGNVLGFPQPVFSVDMSKNKKMLAAGCGDGSVVIFNLN